MAPEKAKNGFSLVETIIAISIIGMVIVAAAQLTQKSMAIGKNTMDRFLALHYAEEGLEIVRNIRDTNWLKNKIWRDGLADGVYIVIGGLDAKAPFGLSPALTFTGIPLSAEDFSRIIEISSLADGSGMEAASTVKYSSRGEAKEIKLKAKFTDWKKGPI